MQGVLGWDRYLIEMLLRLKLWRLGQQMHLVEVLPCRGTCWLFERMLKRQNVDDLHHAPCCPANHYHRRRLVFQQCSCGALKGAGEEGN